MDGIALIEVADDGPGLSEEDSRWVFERFYRSASSRSRSGIGLAIVAAIAETHGGTAEVSSVPSEGTTFTVRIPRDQR